MMRMELSGEAVTSHRRQAIRTEGSSNLRGYLLVTRVTNVYKIVWSGATSRRRNNSPTRPSYVVRKSSLRHKNDVKSYSELRRNALEGGIKSPSITNCNATKL